MKRLPIVVVLLVILGGGGWLLAQRLAAAPDIGTLYGNVEIRQVDLAFEVEGKVVAMPKHEGDRVSQGETVAEVDPTTYQNLERVGRGASRCRQGAARRAAGRHAAGGHRPGARQFRRSAGNAGGCAGDVRATEGPGGAQRLLAAAARRCAHGAGSASARQVAQTQAAMTEAINGPRVQDIDASRANLRAARGGARTVAHPARTYQTDRPERRHRS